MDRRLDRLYRRYCARGDLRALARLFDLASPQLLSLARHLCADEAEAEDAVQATFVTLIEKRELFDRTRRLEPWITGILSRHARAERRRSERSPDPERLDDRAGSDPSVELERNEVGAQVAQRIDALPGVYAEAVRTHLLEGAGPREIGARLAISPGAASVRVHRGLRLLRRALYPGLAVGLLAPRPARGLGAVRTLLMREGLLAGGTLVPSGPAGLSVGVTIGGFILKKLAIASALIVAAIVTWIVIDLPDPPSPRSDDADLASVRELPNSDARPAETAPVTPQPATARRVVALDPVPPAASNNTSLTVRVAWEQSGMPASDIGVELSIDENPKQNLVTDDDGEVTFEALRAGQATVRVDRARDQRSLQITDGAEAFVELQLPTGIAIHGTVADADGMPVARARVLIASPHSMTPGRIATICDAAGRFELRGLSGDCRLGARADGFAPSELRLLSHPNVGESEEIELTLTLPARGGSLRGLVVDADNRPVAGARLNIGGYQDAFSPERNGWSEPLRIGSDGTYHGPARPLEALTDAEGRFACDGIEMGEVGVRVFVREHAPWSEKVTISGDESDWLDIRLARGTTLRGLITTPDGAPAKAVFVSAWGADPRTLREDTTDAEGRYRLDAVVPGHVTVCVNRQRMRGLGEFRAELELVDGETREWNASVSRGLSITGRVVDSEGRGIDGLEATASTKDPRAQQLRAWTDVEGRFEIEGCEDQPYLVELRQANAPWLGPPEAYRVDVQPGGGDLELIVESGKPARVVGRFVDARGDVVSEVRVWATMQPIRRRVHVDVDSESGAFEIEDLPPGHYSIACSPKGHTSRDLADRELAGGETLDLGTLVLEDPARLVIHVIDASGAAPKGLEAVLQTPQGDQTRFAFAVEGAGLVRSGPMDPGRYAVTLHAPGHASLRRELELAAGESRELYWELAAGVDCVFELTPVGGAENPRYVKVVIETPDGALLLRGFAFDGERVGEVELTERLAPGRYVLRATAGDPELVGELQLQVDASTSVHRFRVPLATPD